MSCHIFILISSLQTGGAERVASTLANYWCRQGYVITLVLLDAVAKSNFYKVHPRVNVINLDVLGDSASYGKALRNNFARIAKIRKTIQTYKPDIILSLVVETNILTILSTLGLNVPVLVADHADPNLTPESEIWRKMRNICYPLSNKVILLDKYFSQFYTKLIQKKCVVIPNPINLCKKEIKSHVFSSETDELKVISVGRFVKEKRFDRLLKAFSIVVAAYPDVKLTLVGDGAYRTKLENIRDELGLQYSVNITGFVTNPEAYLTASDIFVLSSDSEGFPMVLCEAMACGLPVVVTKYHAGVKTLVKDGNNGFIVEKNVEMLAEKIKILIEDKNLREAMGNFARQSMQHYSIQIIDTKWKDLFSQFVNV